MNLLSRIFVCIVFSLVIVGCDLSNPIYDNIRDIRNYAKDLVIGWLPEDAALEQCGLDEIEVNHFTTEAIQTPFNVWREKQLNTESLFVSPAYDELGSTPQYILGYPENFSVSQGETLKIFFAAGLRKIGEQIDLIRIYRLSDHELLEERNLRSENKMLETEPCKSYFRGCGFSKNISVSTEKFENGLYYAVLLDNLNATSAPIYFHIRPKAIDVASADIVLILSELTWHAYNSFGGGSLYRIDKVSSSGKIEIVQNSKSYLFAVSTQKPLLTNPSRVPFSTNESRESIINNLADLDFNPGLPIFKSFEDAMWMRTSPESHAVFQRFFSEHDLSVATVAQADLMNDSSILDEAGIILFSGHNEYWTDGMLNVYRNFVNSGGSVLNFSGNLMWWRITYEDEVIYQDQNGSYRTPACKEAVPKQFIGTGHVHRELDIPITDQTLGVNWRFANYPLGQALAYPEDFLIKYLNLKHNDIDVDLAQGLSVLQPDHPLFSELTYDEEMIFHDVPLIANEVDGIPIGKSGEVDRSFSSNFPKKIEVLASANVFIINRIYDRTGTSYMEGVNKVGFIVETDLDGKGPQKSISVPTIGYSMLLAGKEERARKLLLNSYHYLKENRITSDNKNHEKFQ